MQLAGVIPADLLEGKKAGRKKSLPAVFILFFVSTSTLSKLSSNNRTKRIKD